MNTTTDTTTTCEYALVTLGRGTATHVEGWTNDTTRCVNDWNLGRRVVRTHAAGTGRPTCKKCLHSVEAGEASAAAAAPAIAEAVAEIAAEIAADTTSTGRANWIEQLHAWGDCSKHDDKALDGVRHCHCAIEIDALRNERFLTCSRCDRYTVDGRRDWTLVSRRPRGRFYRPVANLVPMTWSQARDLAQTIDTTSTGDVIWYVPTQRKQAANALINSGLAADQDNIMHADGTRVPIRWDAEPQVEAPTTIERFAGMGHDVADTTTIAAVEPVVPALEWHGTAPRTYSARVGGNTRVTVTDVGSGVWSWRVSRLPGRAGRSWFPRTIVWGTTSGRAAAQAAAEQALAAMPKVN